MKELTIQELAKLSPLAVLENEDVKARAVHNFQKMHGVSEEEADNFFEKEKYTFARIIQADENLQKCTAFSIYCCLLDLGAMALTLENVSQPLLYVLWRNAKAGDKWEKRAYLEVSPYGELALRMQKGQIAYADDPVIVYEGDVFKPIINDRGQKICLWEGAVPRKSQVIVGVFIKLTRPDGSFDFPYMLKEEIDRLASYSNKKNNGKTNALYTSNNGQIDTGFLKAKMIKHAFKTFPKIQIGKFGAAKLQDLEAQPEDFGLTGGVPEELKAAPSTTAPVYESQPEPEPSDVFGGAPMEQPQGIQVEDDDDVF